MLLGFVVRILNLVCMVRTSKQVLRYVIRWIWELIMEDKVNSLVSHILFKM
jgi:hypothetical protein